ncbi:MAG: serine/threonine-protein kinase, partial [Myxococcota bacterium]
MPIPLTPEEWARIEAILDDVLVLEPTSRAKALEQACGGDAKLRAQVEALVAADGRAEDFLERPAAEYAAGLVRAASDAEARPDDRDRPGDRIGPYRIIREIGRGGMGRVLLADRADGQFEQQVALKLVGNGQFGGEILQRFLRERQILARLQHPNIARLLDGGVTADGRPYFAMEYVEGEPITMYCDARALDVGARLDLFTAVCEAVQYAHQNLVVHRDLKPSNALVTPGGQVKLLDFGIAKVLKEAKDAMGGEGGDGDDRDLTGEGQTLGTPHYMSPEQASGDDVDARTDVYAFACVLYECIAGHRPLEAATQQKLVYKILMDPPIDLANIAKD